MNKAAGYTRFTAFAAMLLGLLPILANAGSFPLPPEGEDVVGEVIQTQSRYEDTLLDIARNHDLGYREIVAANPDVDPWLPGEGTPITLPTRFILPPGPREGIIINLAELRLYYFPPDSDQVITHPLGIGREGWTTPTGSMQIIEKIPNPAWRVPASIKAEHEANGDPLPDVVPPGPDNPLGAFAMRLSNPQYLIHGTNQPWGVGMRVSHGCIRLYPEDIETLFPQVAKNTPVRIINEPYKAGWLGSTLYIEAHPPLSEQTSGGLSLTPLIKAILDSYGEEQKPVLDWDQARRIAEQHNGIPTPLQGNVAHNENRPGEEKQM
jgi:L,D-transpeptidase ErfK/SrfK